MAVTYTLVLRSNQDRKVKAELTTKTSNYDHVQDITPEQLKKVLQDLVGKRPLPR